MDIVSGINRVKFGLGYANEHDQTYGYFNFRDYNTGNSGYHLMVNEQTNSCEINRCVCQNGEPRSNCHVDGANICASCDLGYRLVGASCKANECYCNYGNAVITGNRRRSYVTDYADGWPSDTDFKVIGDFTGRGTLDFSLEFEIKAIADARLQFCEKTKCILLTIGGWNPLSTAFRSLTGTDKYSDFIGEKVETPGILNKNQYKAFKITFSPNGTIRLFKTSDQTTVEMNNLPRNENGILADDSYVINYESIPILEVQNFQSYPYVDIVNGIDEIKLGTGYGLQHGGITVKFNYKANLYKGHILNVSTFLIQ